jgi:hypothetical protein
MVTCQRMATELTWYKLLTETLKAHLPDRYFLIIAPEVMRAYATQNTGGKMRMMSGSKCST